MPKKTITFVFGLHNHQPTGNFDHVIQEAYEKSYEPFLDLLDRHPSVKVNLHHTGILLDWILAHHPGYLKRLRALGERGQVEFMSGGHYEPILPIIPDHDKVGQILKLTAFIKKHMRKQARGMWLAERVWEPHLPKHIREAGIDYTVVDDMHFKCTGMKDEDCLGYHLTEEMGSSIAVFPISEKLRYTIPFRPVQETIDYLRSIASQDGQRVAVMADDGEKFGVWPNTYKHCYENGWLDEFFTALEDNRDWIKVKTFSQVLDQHSPRGRVYLPAASYIEMMEWALTSDGTREYEEFVKTLTDKGLYEPNKVYVRGGFWRSYQAKYDESNLIHKRMLHISEKVRRARDRHPRSKEITRAQEALWSAQCNCAYWHGVFGGLYLTNLRNALQSNLIEADAIVEKARHKNPAWIEGEEFDLDIDGHPEVILKTPVQNLLFKPNIGGAMIAHDFKPKNLNLIDTLMRREEAYHTKLDQAKLAEEVESNGDGDGSTASIHDLVIAKEPGLKELLTEDWYRKASLIDHFLSDTTSLDEFHLAKYGEDGDFVNQPYSAEWHARAGKAHCTLSREGGVYQERGKYKVRVTKTVRTRSLDGSHTVKYRLDNLTDRDLTTRFGVEFNVNLLAGDAPDRRVYINGRDLKDPRLCSIGEELNVTEFGMVDEWMGVDVKWSFENPITLWRSPVETVSLSEAGFERVYQATTLLALFNDLTIPAEGSWEMDFKVDVTAFAGT